MTVPAPAQIVRHLRLQLAEERYAHLLAPPAVMSRPDFLQLMTPSCWDDDCHECNGIRCACACHDGSLP
jgi:hypothetical protein